MLSAGHSGMALSGFIMPSGLPPSPPTCLWSLPYTALMLCRQIRYAAQGQRWEAGPYQTWAMQLGTCTPSLTIPAPHQRARQTWRTTPRTLSCRHSGPLAWGEGPDSDHRAPWCAQPAGEEEAQAAPEVELASPSTKRQQPCTVTNS